MEKPQIDLHPLSSASARELLEKYLYGSGDVELILRFAEEHNLEKDNLVWLLTSILKVQSNLVIDLLNAIKYGTNMLDEWDAQRQFTKQDLAELANRLEAQISVAAGKGAGELDLRIAKIERLMGNVESLAKAITKAHSDFEDTPTDFTHFMETKMRVWAKEFLADARQHLNPQPWRIYAVSAIQTAVIIGLFIWR